MANCTLTEPNQWRLSNQTFRYRYPLSWLPDIKMKIWKYLTYFSYFISLFTLRVWLNLSNNLLCLMISGRTQGNSMELWHGKFRSDIWKRFFTKRVLLSTATAFPEKWSWHWSCKFKQCMDSAFSRMVWLLCGPMWNQALDLVILIGHFQLDIFYDSV